jgi:hypothetical protein
MSRQRLVGWTLIALSVFYILYFMKARLFAGGEPIAKKEWVYFVLSFVGVLLGTINIRMAEARARGQKVYFSLWPPKK